MMFFTSPAAKLMTSVRFAPLPAECGAEECTNPSLKMVVAIRAARNSAKGSVIVGALAANGVDGNEEDAKASLSNSETAAAAVS